MQAVPNMNNNPEAQMNDTIRELDRDIADLRVSNASLLSSVDGLTKKVDELSRTVSALNDTMNRGKGALWLIVLFAGSLGAMITTLLKKLTGVV